MKPTLLKPCLYIIFGVSLFTGIGDLIGGATAIPGVKTTVAAAADNELRCLAIFWLAFGAFCFWVVRNINARGNFIPAIALVMLVSAIARLLSIIAVGMPGIALFSAMLIEFVISFIIYYTYKASSKLVTSV